MNKNLAKSRIGEVSKTKYGSKMEIVKYNNKDDIWVRFEQGNLVHTRYRVFCNGKVKNVFDKSVLGVGYLGEGNYKVTIKNKTTPQYRAWSSMLQRCYCVKFLLKNLTYKDCSVSEEWHNFQNFAKWHDENYYQVESEIMCLDKDILKKGNKIYSSETCAYVPKSINSLFVKNDVNRSSLSIGVRIDKSKYSARCRIGRGETIQIGTFDTSMEAFQAYKTFKEKLIKKNADKYKDKIPTRIYEAMLNYKVEIDD